MLKKVNHLAVIEKTLASPRLTMVMVTDNSYLITIRKSGDRKLNSQLNYRMII